MAEQWDLGVALALMGWGEWGHSIGVTSSGMGLAGWQIGTLWSCLGQPSNHSTAMHAQTRTLPLLCCVQDVMRMSFLLLRRMTKLQCICTAGVPSLTLA